LLERTKRPLDEKTGKQFSLAALAMKKTKPDISSYSPVHPDLTWRYVDM